MPQAHASGDLPDQSWAQCRWSITRSAGSGAKLGDQQAALAHFKRAAALPPDYCFPARLEEIAILEAAMRANPRDARAPYYLGNLLYDRRRHEEAIRLWERSARLDPKFSIVWRNLGIGYFNIRQQARQSPRGLRQGVPGRTRPTRACSTSATNSGSGSARQPAKRLRELEKHLDLVRQRDDLSVELCALYNQTGQHDRGAGARELAATFSRGKAAKAGRWASMCAPTWRWAGRRWPTATTTAPRAFRGRARLRR